MVTKKTLALFHNDYSSPPLVITRKGSFLDLHCESLVWILKIQLWSGSLNIMDLRSFIDSGESQTPASTHTAISSPSKLIMTPTFSTLGKQISFVSLDELMSSDFGVSVSSVFSVL